MTSLDSGFEADLRDAILDEAERELVGKQGNIVHEFVQDVHDRLRAYGRRHDDDVEHAIESLGQPVVERTANSITVRIGWEATEMVFFEMGTSDHTVDGDPVLVFDFDETEYPHLAEMFPEGTAYLPDVDVSGLPESRAVRDSLNHLQGALA